MTPPDPMAEARLAIGPTKRELLRLIGLTTPEVADLLAAYDAKVRECDGLNEAMAAAESEAGGIAMERDTLRTANARLKEYIGNQPCGCVRVSLDPPKWKRCRRCQLVDPEPQPAPEQREQFMPRVGGKSFRCSCDCNVFHRGDGPHAYVCNGCGAIYDGLPMTAPERGGEETGA